MSSSGWIVPEDMRQCIVSVLAVSALCVFGGKPNVILIVADDLGWRDTGVYGSTFYQTPHIDHLAAEGMRFTEAYSASPLCSSSRCAIMTGQFPSRTGFTAAAGHFKDVILKAKRPNNAGPLFRAITPKTITRMDTLFTTIAESLKDAGYATAHYGKWHLGEAGYLASDQGFDEVIGGDGYPGPKSYFSPYKMKSVPDAEKGLHIDMHLVNNAVEFMKKHEDEPFYINLWLYSVHTPLQADPKLLKKYETLRDPDNLQNNATMAAMTESMDDCIGVLMDALRTQGLDENTMVIFTSDNGGLVEPWKTFGSPTSNDPLREGKGWNYEGGTRVPLIVRWPGKVEEGAVSKSPVSGVDFYPTILELAGASAKPDQVQDGFSIVPVLNGEVDVMDREVFCFFPHYLQHGTGFPKEPAAYLRQGDFKLIRFFGKDGGTADLIELYDLSRDIGETKNLADSMPEKTAAMNARIGDILAETQAVCPVPNPSFDENARLIVAKNGTAYNFTTYSQRGDCPYVSVFSPKSMYRKKIELTFKLARPVDGVVYWSSENNETLKDREVRFAKEDVAADGTLEIAVGNDGSNVKDVRIEAPGAGDDLFISMEAAKPGDEPLFVFDLVNQKLL